MSIAVVLLSGGQDSVTSLFWAKMHFDEVHTISVRYGQRHIAELESAKRAASLAGAASAHVVDLGQALGTSSALIDSAKELLGSGGLVDKEMPQGLPTSFVPGRNTLLLLVAAVRAVEIGAHDIVTGVCQTDYSGYPDCRRDFIDSLEKTIAAGFPSGVLPLRIITPLMHLTKEDTVRMANRLGEECWDALSTSITCYYGKRPGCGECPACHLRADGFKSAGYDDPAGA